MVQNPMYSLFLEALKFRDALEKCDRSLLPENSNNFPSGLCREINLIFSCYLKEKGFGEFDYVEGKRRGRVHSWLKCGNTIVDITADQFDDMIEKVIVSSRSCWHDEFGGIVVHRGSDFELNGDLNYEGFKDLIFGNVH